MNTTASVPTPDPSLEPTPAATPERGANEERPGVLRGNATLTVHTRQAQRLVRGRPATPDKPAIIGLLGFANLLRAIWHGARANDPYADGWLLRIHAALEHTHSQIAETRATLVLDETGPITVAPASSVKPVRVPLQFSNAYAFRGAWLLAAYDGLVCAVLTARHVGVLPRDEAEQILHHGGRRARRALSSPLGYRLLGVTRRDIEQGTARAVQAREAMGELPPDVLQGTRRAPHAPTVAAPLSSGVEHLSLQPLARAQGSGNRDAGTAHAGSAQGVADDARASE